MAVIAIAVIATRSSDGDDPSASDASSQELGFPKPQPEDAEADRDYLQGDGRVLLVMHERAKAFVESEANAEQCRQEAQALDDVASADEVLSWIGGISDGVLRDALHAERTALGLSLTRCILGTVEPATGPPGLEQAVEAVDARLQDLGG